jgi:spore coat protein A
MYVIGADGGLLAAPVKVKTLTMMPGERLDVLIDFTGYTGKVQLKNTNLDGFYTSPAPRLVDFLQFNIVPPVPGQSHTRNNTVPQSLDLVDGTAKLTSSGTVRTINMFEMNANALHWWMGLLGTGGGANDVNVPAGGFADLITPAWNANTFHQPIGERPQQGAVQDWDFINNTADSHPMHIHLVQFQVVHRRAVGAAAIPPDGTLVSPWETGWNDTISVHPGQVTRVRVKFDLPPPTPAGTPDPANFTPAGVSDKYDLDTTTGEARRCFVYHCHILEHEENDMMRPFLVT